jgi:hypothetical protein
VRVLLDHCVHAKVRLLLPDVEVVSAHRAGFANLRNGVLLAAASRSFQAIITIDKNIYYQHNLQSLPIAVVELSVRFNRWDYVKRLGPFLPRAIQATTQFRFVRLHEDGQMETFAAR